MKLGRKAVHEHEGRFFATLLQQMIEPLDSSRDKRPQGAWRIFWARCFLGGLRVLPANLFRIPSGDANRDETMRLNGWR